MLEILDTGTGSAEDNMRFDETLLKDLSSSGSPILHFYQWAHPSATYGYFIRPEEHLDLGKAAEYRLDLARRPTGGGIVFHIWDLAFSFLMPSAHPKYSSNTLENYHFVNQIVLESVREYFSLSPQLHREDPSASPPSFDFCMAKPTQYDVVCGGKKIAGAAQRKQKQGYLHQGTISLASPDRGWLEELLLSKEEIAPLIASATFAPIENPLELNRTRKEIEKLLADKFRAALTF